MNEYKLITRLNFYNKQFSEFSLNTNSDEYSWDNWVWRDYMHKRGYK